MISIPLALFIVILHFVFGNERAANQAAHELCPETHVVRVDEHFEFGCEGSSYSVDCSRGDCDVRRH